MQTETHPKTLVFSFDGTGNEPADAGGFTEDESISNVLKLHILMGGSLEGRATTSTPAGSPQHTFYYSGIGTRVSNRVVSLLNMMVAPRFGDARRILSAARTDLLASYERGDRVLVFGFSRGAALARKFVSQMLEENLSDEVAFLGVFDTVAALGGVHRKGERIRTDVVFENGSLHEGVRRAVHLLALDETRIPFTPTQINKDQGNPARILEAWFPGVHSDVGGGYWLDGLSDIALAFMMRECQRTLGDDVRIDAGTRESLQTLLRHKGDALPGIEVDDLLVHPMVHGALHSHSGLMVKVGKEAPRRVCVRVNDHPSSDPADTPIVHHSVGARFAQVSGYRPNALRGLRFRLLMPDGRVSKDAIDGIAGLLENQPPARNLGTMPMP
ncbi:MAG: DUF2235 domain-containing protein [Gammaproteobacteria bacterium]|nr:DUF2235 domain-containing protein [Gammaproteobacteria bacterium]